MILLFAPHLGAMAEVSKEQLAEIYRDKLPHLRQYIIATHTVISMYDGSATPNLVLDLEYEYARKNDDGALTKTSLDPSTNRAKVLYRDVLCGGVYKALFTEESKDKYSAIIWADGFGARIGQFGGTFLGYSLLSPLYFDTEGRPTHNAANSDLTALMAQPDSRVLPELHDCGGHPCYVIEWGPEDALIARWFLDESLGFAVRRVEAIAGAPDSSRYLKYEVDFDNFNEVAPQLFLPGRGFQTSYLEGGKNLFYTLEWTDIRATVDREVPEALFVLEFPEGTEVTDDIAHTQYIHPYRVSGEESQLLSVAQSSLSTITKGMEKDVSAGAVVAPSPMIGIERDKGNPSGSRLAQDRRWLTSAMAWAFAVAGLCCVVMVCAKTLRREKRKP